MKFHILGDDDDGMYIRVYVRCSSQTSERIFDETTRVHEER